MGAATGNVATGDRVFLGEQASYEEANLYTVGLVSASGFYVTPPNRKSLPFGSTLYSSSSYGLWDATKNQACKCDPGFTGYACDERVCPHGADPLDSRGEDYNQSTSMDSVASYYTKATETQTLSLDTSCGTASGFFTVTHTDQITGEKLLPNVFKPHHNFPPQFLFLHQLLPMPNIAQLPVPTQVLPVVLLHVSNMLHLNHIYQPTKWKSVISFVLVKNTVKLVCLLQMALLVTIPLHTLRLVFPLHTKPVLLHSVPMPNKL